MNNCMKGKIEFYKEDEIPTTSKHTFKGDPNKIVKGECRRRLKINGQIWCIVLTGNFVYFSTIQVMALHKKFVDACIFDEAVREISIAFYTTEDNTIKNISKITGYKFSLVSKVIDRFLLTKEEVVP